MASVNFQFAQTSSKLFAETARRLYGNDVDLDRAFLRFSALGSEHATNFGVKECTFFSSPGRIELCGNHTDHQHGKVLCASINLDTLAAVTPTTDNKIYVKSGAYPLIEVDLANLTLGAGEAGTSLALVKGVARYYIEHGLGVGGFVATMTSNVAKGSGVSSSASFECCIAEIFNAYYNDGKLDAVTKAKASQWAESAYFGKPCGLLDQCAIALGDVAYIDFANPESPAVEKLEFPFDVSIFLVNSGGDHSKLTGCYTSIRTEMEQVAKVMGGEVLADVAYDSTMFAKAYQAGLSGRAAMRALHFFGEQERVDKAVGAIKAGDAPLFYEQLNRSGESSDRYLQNTYVPGDDRQPIPFAVEFLRSIGARCCRVHGGGFAGTVLGIFERPDAPQAYAALCGVYGQENIFRVQIRKDGATNTKLEAKL